MKKPLILCLSLALLTGLFSACSKKTPFSFTGRENEEQAFAKCVQLSTRKKFQQSIDCLEIFKSRFPDSKYALEAELKIGDAYYRKKEYLLAAETYQLYTKLHPTSEKLDYAYYRIGLSYLHESPKQIDRDQEHLPAAIDSFAIVVTQYPNSQYAKIAKQKYDEARRKIAQRNFYVGRFYYKWGEYKAAIPRFMEVYEKFANLGLDEDALYYTIESFHRLGKNDDAKAVLEILKGKYPNSGKIKKVPKEVLKT
ncbi:MAG: outer membrane protein assembly factor BamD [bacterium]